MNPQPVSLADELRKLAEDLKKGRHSYNGMVHRDELVEILSTLLAQHAVAEPPNAAIAELEGIIIELRKELNNTHAAFVRNSAVNPPSSDHQKLTDIWRAVVSPECLDLTEYIEYVNNSVLQDALPMTFQSWITGRNG